MGIEKSIEDEIVIKPHKPDKKELIFFLLSGFLISVPFTIFLGQFTDVLCMTVFYTSICSVAIFTPFVEEFAKAYPLFYRHGETERSLFKLGFLTGLGFGISEFFLFVFALDVSPVLRLPGLFFHAASTSITTYGIANKRVMRFYLIAVALHALNNFSAFFGPIWFIGGISAVVITYLISWRLFKRSSEQFVAY